MEVYEFMKTTGEKTNMITRQYTEWAKRHGVNFNILAVLYTAYHKKNCSQKYVCIEWNIPKQTINTTCRDLMASGIIEQVQSTGDKREICISLTDKGKKLAAPIVKELLAIESRILDDMGQEKINQFFDLYNEFADSVEKQFSVK